MKKTNYKIGDFVFDNLQEIKVKINSINTKTLPHIYTVVDDEQVGYKITSDDLTEG